MANKENEQVARIVKQLRELGILWEMRELIERILPAEEALDRLEKFIDEGFYEMAIIYILRFDRYYKFNLALNDVIENILLGIDPDEGVLSMCLRTLREYVAKNNLEDYEVTI